MMRRASFANPPVSPSRAQSPTRRQLEFRFAAAGNDRRLGIPKSALHATPVTMLDLFKRKSAEEEKKPWSARLAEGLTRSREKLTGALTGAFSRRKLDEETLEELETALLTADVGVAATQQILDDLRARWKRAAADDDPKQQLKAALLELIAPLEK